MTTSVRFVRCNAIAPGLQDEPDHATPTPSQQIAAALLFESGIVDIRCVGKYWRKSGSKLRHEDSIGVFCVNVEEIRDA
jgi:hypothetical protein